AGNGVRTTGATTQQTTLEQSAPDSPRPVESGAGSIPSPFVSVQLGARAQIPAAQFEKHASGAFAFVSPEASDAGLLVSLSKDYDRTFDWIVLLPTHPEFVCEPSHTKKNAGTVYQLLKRGGDTGGLKHVLFDISHQKDTLAGDKQLKLEFQRRSKDARA